jgi:AhpD family alkylhydroperoxidase
MGGMPRIPYLPAHLAEPAELVAAIRGRRGGRLLELDRVLLRSPPLARGWNALLGAVRGELALDPKLRELAICAVGLLNGAGYEVEQHAPELLRAGGTEAQLAALRRGRGADDGSGAFDEAEGAVLLLTFEITRDVEVSDATFAAVRDLLGERATVELVAVVACYNMVSRFLVALDVAPE